jgi:hypothetical protein
MGVIPRTHGKCNGVERWSLHSEKQGYHLIPREIFLGVFKLLYDKHCPIKEINIKFKYSDSSWITKGLQNACKRKIHYIKNS